MVRKCISKEELRCFYLTKDNYKEFLDEQPFFYDEEDVVITEKLVGVKSLSVQIMFRFGWYVEEYNEYCGCLMWEHYSDEYFKNNFQLVNEEENLATVNEIKEFLLKDSKDNNGEYAKELEQRLFLLTGCGVFGRQDGMAGCCVDCCDENPKLFDKCTEFTEKVRDYNMKNLGEKNE